jgi:Spy/CpxP family protein refolding chaperone
MSPQFVDFDADGKLDIVCGTYDGSAHLVRGTDKGWGTPEHILDKNGERIALNSYWDVAKKKWITTTKHDAPARAADAAHGKGEAAHVEGHLTSAIAFDADGDGDLDLLLGDHRSGRVHRRINEGTAQKPSFGTINEVVMADGKPIDVPGTVATMRLVDWNGDGLLDLACGAMGDPFGNDAGGGVYVFPNTGTAKAPAFGAPITLLEPSRKDAQEATRPDAGIYMDFADHDGDGDLDMVVGAYSMWQPQVAKLTAEQEALRDKLKADRDAIDKESSAIFEAIEKELKASGLKDDEAEKKRSELHKTKSTQLQEIFKRRQAVHQQIEPLEPTTKRVPYVWLYEQVQKGAKSVGKR